MRTSRARCLINSIKTCNPKTKYLITLSNVYRIRTCIEHSENYFAL